MAREKKDTAIITFRVPRLMAEELDAEIERWNEETGTAFTRSMLLKVLIMRFLIGREQERMKEDNAKDNVNKEEE